MALILLNMCGLYPVSWDKLLNLQNLQGGKYILDINEFFELATPRLLWDESRHRKDQGMIRGLGPSAHCIQL